MIFISFQMFFVQYDLTKSNHLRVINSTDSYFPLVNILIEKKKNPRIFFITDKM